MHVPAYSVVDVGTDLVWAQFSELIRVSKWRSHDNLILSLLPSLHSTRCVFAVSDEDGSFLGAVVWNEVDEIAWIGMYLCAPSVRGVGIGSKIWKRAMERIKESGKALGLRGVPHMAPKYAANGTPFEISRLRYNVLSCKELRELSGKLQVSQLSASIKVKSELSEEQIEELLHFDQLMTGRDRRDILIPFLASPTFECAVLLNEKGHICGWAAITSVGLEEERLFKLAPVYASSLTQFAHLTEVLIPFCERESLDSSVVINILSGTVGERELEPLLSNPQKIERVTLFSEKIDWKLKKDSCFSPHNTCCHFDG